MLTDHGAHYVGGAKDRIVQGTYVDKTKSTCIRYEKHCSIDQLPKEYHSFRREIPKVRPFLTLMLALFYWV